MGSCDERSRMINSLKMSKVKAIIIVVIAKTFVHIYMGPILCPHSATGETRRLEIGPTNYQLLAKELKGKKNNCSIGLDNKTVFDNCLFITSNITTKTATHQGN